MTPYLKNCKMKRVDQILSYLAGEMVAEERLDFEKVRKRDAALQRDYEQLSRAWKLVRDECREQDEAAFQKALTKAMTQPPPQQGISKGRKRLWWFIIPLAASLAMLLATPMMRKQDSAFPRFFHPEKDGIVQALGQESRAPGGNMASLYFLEAYEACYLRAGMKLEEDPGDQLARLFLYLSACETGHEIQALEKGGSPPEPASSLDQAVTWYHILLLVKTGDFQEARAKAGYLAGSDGPYAADAHKLKRRLQK